jgi:hypothetical protein
MTTNTENDPAGGAQGTPTPETSPQGAPTSVDVNSFVAALKGNPEFASLVKELALPVAQSTKDRRFDKLEKRQDSFAEQLARFQELKGEGFSDKAALRLMQLEVEPDAGQPSPDRAAQAAPRGSEQQPAPKLNTDLLEVLGLPINDPDVVELIRAGKTGDDNFIKLAKERKARTVQPNPSAVTPVSQGVGSSGKDELSEVTAELTEALKNPLANMERIRELQARQAKLLPRR